MKETLYERVMRHLERKSWFDAAEADLRAALSDLDQMAERIERVRRRVSGEFVPELGDAFVAARGTIKKLLREQGRGRSRWAASL